MPTACTRAVCIHCRLDIIKIYTIITYCPYGTKSATTWSCLFLQQIHRITKSPNVWGWKAHLEVTSPTPLKQGHLELLAHDQVRLGFGCLQGMRLHNFSGKLCQCSATFKVEMCFLLFRQSLLCLSMCPLPSDLAMDTTEMSLAPSSFPPIKYLYTLLRRTWASSSPDCLIPLSLSLHERGASSLITSVALCCVCSLQWAYILYWGAQSLVQLQVWLTRAKQRGRITSLDQCCS